MTPADRDRLAAEKDAEIVASDKALTQSEDGEAMLAAYDGEQERR